MRWSNSPILAVLMLLLVAGLIAANIGYARAAHGGFHFLPGWLAARTWLQEGGLPYSPGLHAQAERMMYGRTAEPEIGETLGGFVYPVPALIAYLPFAPLQYEVARGLWMVALELVLIGMVLVGHQLVRQRPPSRGMVLSLVFALTCLHSLQGLLVGQLAIVEAMLLAAGLLAIARGNDLMAGILLGLAILKPQMSFLLVPFVLLWSRSVRRWTIPVAWASTLAVVLGGSVLVYPQWPLEWARQIVYLVERVPARTAIAAISLPGTPAQAWTAALLTGSLLIYMLWEWSQASGREGRWFQWTAWLTMVVTALIGPRWTSIDNVMLIPAWLWLFDGWSERWKRQGILLALAVGALLIAAPWGIFLRSDLGAPEAAGVYLVFPLAALLGLWWHRWWSTRADVLPLE